MTYDKIEKKGVLDEVDYVCFEATSLDTIDAGGLAEHAVLACCCCCCASF